MVTQMPPPPANENTNECRVVCCSHCADVISGDVFMLADRAYCSPNHRRNAFENLRWDASGRLLPLQRADGKRIHAKATAWGWFSGSRAAATATNKSPSASRTAPTPQTVEKRFSSSSRVVSISRSQSMISREKSIEATCITGKA
uniref:Uncharacterized protein n=1 Tax=Strombidinopsis acuminata TaxID=141414 RepID=A0A7S3RZ45_9SPIT|mmetsp:Transcript_17549/g.53037  ORF Transcript_17549/g.53037 Transcript_17549/m.53037 type:complete len:145 (-) Transcript_17549:739-1173(-)